MILRYYDMDWSVPCMENELLFTGTKEECVKYLFKHWSVDVKEYEDNPELLGTFTDYLHHIQFSHKSFDEKTVDDIYLKHPDWDQTEWHKINAQKFIYNRELIEEIVDDSPIEYPLWEMHLEEEIQGIFDRKIEQSNAILDTFSPDDYS